LVQQIEFANVTVISKLDLVSAQDGATLAEIRFTRTRMRRSLARTRAGSRLMPFGPPEWPAAANLTPHGTGLHDWSFGDFERAITQGISKDGRRLREPMTSVVQSAKAMLPTERKAIWTYLRSTAPIATSE
jgi:hypothetical protein